MPRVSVNVLLDHETEQKIARRRHVVAPNTLVLTDTDKAKYPPHITLAAYALEDRDVPAYAARLPTLTASWQCFPVLLESLGIFPETRVLFLAPRVSQTLLLLHQAVLELFSAPLVDEVLLPSRWTPHVTLAASSSAEELLGILAQELRAWSPIVGEAIGIAIRVLPSPTHHKRSLFAKEP